jgi:hypothetical protein
MAGDEHHAFLDRANAEAVSVGPQKIAMVAAISHAGCGICEFTARRGGELSRNRSSEVPL